MTVQNIPFRLVGRGPADLPAILKEESSRGLYVLHYLLPVATEDDSKIARSMRSGRKIQQRRLDVIFGDRMSRGDSNNRN